jgi:hypothetical protein
MPTVQALSQPQDTNGQSYPAIRPGRVNQLALAANTAIASGLLAQTKVVRVSGAVDVYVHIGPAGTDALPANDPLVAAAHYQDFVVYPGEVVSIVSTVAGTCSLIELA